MSVRTYVLLGFLGAIMLGAFVPLQPEIAVASTHGATRSFSAPWVLPEGQLQVTVTASGYGVFGLLKETLPAGFTFVESDLAAATVKVDGQTVIFTLLGAQLVTYNVTAPAAEGQYDFSGVLLDDAETGGNNGRGLVHQGWSGADGHTHAGAHAHRHAPRRRPHGDKPTATPAPTATPDPTPTPSPQPTSTATAVPTATPMPAPTAVTLVATPTATAAPPVEDAEEEAGTPVYVWLPMVLLVFALLVAIVVYVRMRR